MSELDVGVSAVGDGEASIYLNDRIYNQQWG